MAREKEGFREQLDRLDAAFPGLETLRYKEISILFGVQSGNRQTPLEAVL
ncbi:MAG: hypothetical protein II012_03115 [Ruminococcus sp.]|nr:hypothetical protein [Ruminococcus sp.]